MTKLLRRQIMALMLGTAAVSFTAPFLFDAPAFAKDGSSGGDSDSDGGSGGSSGSGDGDSDGGESGSSGSSGDSDGDDSGNDGGSGDDDGTPDQGSGDNGSDDNDDDDNDDDSAAKAEKKAAKKAQRAIDRPTVTITLTEASLSSVQAGTHVVVDQLGRELEITVRTVNGQQVITAKPHGGAAKRNPGPIDTINVVPVSTVAGNDDGTPDQGSGDN